MDKNWLDREITFENLDLPPELESECAGDLTDELDNGLPYIEDLDPDAEYIKAVASGEYRHEMPKRPSPKEHGSGWAGNVVINAPDEKALLAGFANIMGWDRTDLTEEGYLKAVVQNKTGKAAVIKDLIGIRSSENENS